jgi:hypothetical protein
MPFKSEKQRRYLYSQKPEVAKKFAVDSAKKGKIIKLKGGGADMGDPGRAQERADRGYGSTAGVDRSKVSATQQSNHQQSVKAANQVQAKTGPLQVPTIGPLTYVFNKISTGLYNAKNLKDARKNDLLGGEMLTTGQKTTGPAGNYGGNDNNNSLCPDGTNPPCKTPTTQIKAPAKTPNAFLSGFKAYDDGGEVIISSNVDKSLL